MPRPTERDGASPPLYSRVARGVRGEIERTQTVGGWRLHGHVTTPHGIVVATSALVEMNGRLEGSTSLRMVYGGRIWLHAGRGFVPSRRELAGRAGRFARRVEAQAREASAPSSRARKSASALVRR